MASAGNLIARLRLDSKQFNTALKSNRRSITQFGAKMQATGKRMTTALSLPLALAGAAAAKVAVDFDKSMTKIQTLVGVNADQVNDWREELLAIGPALGKTPNELADALFTITSAGARGAEAMDILTGAAKASAVGLGETKDVARAVVSAVNVYRASGLTAAAATDVMVAAVRAGNLEAADLAGSLGNVLGIANAMGVSFAESTAFIASFTKAGADANVAATSLVAVMSTFLKTTPKQVLALNALGISVKEVRDKIKKDGLAVAMVQLIGSFEGNIDALGEVIGNVRALRGALSTAASQGKDYIKIAREITNSQGALNDAFAVTSQTMAHQFDEFKSKVVVVGIALGSVLAPMLLTATNKISEFLTTITKADLATRVWIVGIGLAVIALGPLIASLGVTVKLLMFFALTAVPAAARAVRTFAVVAAWLGVGGSILLGLAFVVKTVGLLIWGFNALAATILVTGGEIDGLSNKFRSWGGEAGKALDATTIFLKKFVLQSNIASLEWMEKWRSRINNVYALLSLLPGDWGGDFFAMQQERQAKNAKALGDEIAKIQKEMAFLTREFDWFWEGEKPFIGPLQPELNVSAAAELRAQADALMRDIEALAGGGFAKTVTAELEESVVSAGKSAVESLSKFMQASKDRLQDALDVTPAQKFTTELRRGQEEIAKLFKTAEAGGATARAELEKLADTLGIDVANGVAAFQGAYQKTMEAIRDETADTADFIKFNIGESIASTMDEMFSGFLRGTRDLESLTETWSNAMIGIVEDMFSQMLKSKLNFDVIFKDNFLKDLLPAVAEFAFEAMRLIGGVFGWTPSSGSQVARAFQTPAHNVGAPAGPGALDFGGYASHGGITMGPSLAVVGDNPSGKEAIIPLERWSEIMGGSGGSPEIHIHAPTALKQKNEGRRSDGRKFMELIFDGAKGAVAEDISRGGAVSRAISAKFGTAGTGGV